MEHGERRESAYYSSDEAASRSHIYNFHLMWCEKRDDMLYRQFHLQGEADDVVEDIMVS